MPKLENFLRIFVILQICLFSNFDNVENYQIFIVDCLIYKLKNLLIKKNFKFKKY